VAFAAEVDVDDEIGWFGAWFKAPSADGFLGGRAEKSVAGFNLGVGDGAVWLNDEMNNDRAADVHPAGEFGVDGGDFGDYGTVRVGSEG
jgi:hypothetical protein